MAANQGLDWAQNHGVEWVLLLNDDAILAPGCWAALSQARAPDVGVIAPLLVDDQGHASAGVHMRRWGRVKLRSSPPKGADPLAVSGMYADRSQERLDIQYRHGMEDFDLCRRIRQQGKRILVIQKRGVIIEGDQSFASVEIGSTTWCIRSSPLFWWWLAQSVGRGNGGRPGASRGRSQRTLFGHLGRLERLEEATRSLFGERLIEPFMGGSDGFVESGFHQGQQ